MLGAPENHLLFAVGLHDHPLPAVQFAVDNQSREKFLDAFEQGADAVFALVADDCQRPLRLVGDFDLITESVDTQGNSLIYMLTNILYLPVINQQLHLLLYGKELR